MADYNNMQLAKLFVEAGEHVGDSRYEFWKIALDEAEYIYGIYANTLVAAGLADEGQSFVSWKSSKNGKDIIKAAFELLNTQIGGKNGEYTHLIWSGCQPHARDLVALTKSHLSTLVQAAALPPDDWAGYQDVAGFQNVVGGTNKTFWDYVENLPAITPDTPAVTWTRRLFGDVEGGKETRAALGAYGWNACDPNGSIKKADLETWIRVTMELFFNQAVLDEQTETLGDKDITWSPAHLLLQPQEVAAKHKKILEAREALREAMGYTALKHDIEYKEQCFLLSNIQEFAAVKLYLDHAWLDGVTPENKILPDPHGYNSSLMLHGDPYNLINRLTQSPHKETFFEMPTQAISALQPMIRLYKIESDNNGSEHEVEMKFDSHYRKEDVEEFMVTKEIRGHGIGIKSFTFSFEGADPWSSTRSMKAKLVLFANSFDEFMKDRAYLTTKHRRPVPEWHYSDDHPTRTATYRYIDLAIKTGGTNPGDQPQDTASPHNKDVRIEDTTKLNFRLKAIVGWAPPLLDHTIVSGELLDAIYDSCITLNLTPTIHEFGIDEMGRTTLTINYWGSAEEFFDQPQYNIFTDPNVATRQMVRRLRYKILNENCEDPDLKAAVIESKNSEKEAQNIKNEKIINMRSLMNNMFNEKKIRYLRIPLAELQKYHAGGPFYPIDKKLIEILRLGATNYVEAGSAEAADIFQNTPEPTETGDEGSGGAPAVEPPTGLISVRPRAGQHGPGGGLLFGTETPYIAPPIPEGIGDYKVNDPIETVSFFYAGDLIDTILKHIGITITNLPEQLMTTLAADPVLKKYPDVIQEEVNNYKRFAENFMKFRVILGPIELLNTNTKGKLLDSKIFNLGDIPVSAKYFMEFLNERVFKRERETYTLSEFLNDFFMIFLRDFLNKDSCYGNRTKQKTILHKNVITAYNEDQHVGQDPIAHWCNIHKRRRMDVDEADDQPILNVMGKRNNAGFDGGFENEMHYLTYFVARVQPTEQMLGCKHGPCDTGEVDDKTGAPIEVDGDHDRYLWHYQIGKDRGIVKSIDLVKNQTPGLAEARWASEGYDNLQQLRVLYNANIKTFLDVNTYPGTYIYIEPRGFDPNTDVDLTQFGIGGYFMIKSAEHTLGPGLAETTIDARWVNEISTGGLGKKAPLQETDAEPVVLKKCHTALLPERAPHTKLDAALIAAEVPLSDEPSYDPLENRDDPT